MINLFNYFYYWYYDNSNIFSVLFLLFFHRHHQQKIQTRDKKIQKIIVRNILSPNLWKLKVLYLFLEMKMVEIIFIFNYLLFFNIKLICIFILNYNRDKSNIIYSSCTHTISHTFILSFYFFIFSSLSSLSPFYPSCLFSFSFFSFSLSSSPFPSFPR